MPASIGYIGLWYWSRPDLARGNDCGASWDEPFQSLQNAMEEFFRDRCDIEIGQLAALLARFSERGSGIGEVPRTKLSINAAKASGSSCVVR